MTPDLIAACKAAFAASTKTTGEVAVMYLANARIAFEAAAEELRALERSILARELELAHSRRPKHQEPLALDEAKP